MPQSNTPSQCPALRSLRTVRGRVLGLRGNLIVASLPNCGVGSVCTITISAQHTLTAVLISFLGDSVLLAPFEPVNGLIPGSIVTSTGEPLQINYRDSSGQVLDCVGHALNDTDADKNAIIKLPLENTPPNPLRRAVIEKQCFTGVTAIDLLCPIGLGQRVAIQAGAGVGKSTLLGMLARNAEFDHAVIALIGERGREVRDFIDHNLGPEGLRRSTIVVATSDEAPIRRIFAGKSAVAIAEYYRAQGKRVLLLFDSLTRYARALRDNALAAGELPARQGFPPSVYSELPRLLERTGNNQSGSITAFFTALGEGELADDLLSQEMQSLLDGHIVLSAQAREAGLLPAIDPVRSLSRLAEQLQPESEIKLRRLVVRIISRLWRDKDTILLGGSPDSELREGMEIEEKLYRALSQCLKEKRDLASSVEEITSLMERLSQCRNIIRAQS